jgi:hypothetical protein
MGLHYQIAGYYKPEAHLIGQHCKNQSHYMVMELQEERGTQKAKRGKIYLLGNDRH